MTHGTERDTQAIQLLRFPLKGTPDLLLERFACVGSFLLILILVIGR